MPRTLETRTRVDESQSSELPATIDTTKALHYDIMEVVFMNGESSFRVGRPRRFNSSE